MYVYAHVICFHIGVYLNTHTAKETSIGKETSVTGHYVYVFVYVYIHMYGFDVVNVC